MGPPAFDRAKQSGDANLKYANDDKYVAIFLFNQSYFVELKKHFPSEIYFFITFYLRARPIRF